jgi:uncharacterized protein (TIGR02145 family)
MSYLNITASITALLLLCGCANDNPVSLEDNGYEKGIVADIDNNLYETIKIGEQWWMAENLRVTQYRNGVEIFTGIDDTIWQIAVSGIYAVYPYAEMDSISTDEEMLEAYGALYNWYAVADERGLCPEGWRVPGDGDWKQLELFLGVSQQTVEKTGWRGTDEGGKLKSTLTSPIHHPHWNNPNIGATNETGWSGLPGGFRDYNGDFIYIGTFGRWWSSTEHVPGGDYALFRSLGSNYSGISRFVARKQDGFSVRCIMN